MGVCNCSMFCCTLLYVHSSIAIILMGKRELIALLNLSSWCLVMVERLFLAVPPGSLQFVIVVFPDHTHLLFLMATDASLFKYGVAILTGHDIGTTFRDFWASGDNRPIHLKEADTIFKALSSMVSRVADSRVDILTDNMAVIQSFENQGGKCRSLNNIMKQIFAFLCSYNVDLHLRYVPTNLNEADCPSRQLSLADSTLAGPSWMLVERHFGPHTVDRMALDSNAMKSSDGMSLRHFTPGPSPLSSGVNIFSQNISCKTNPYVFPPISMIFPFVSFLKEQHVRGCTLVAPVLQSFPIWWPILQSYCIRSVLIGRLWEKGVIKVPSKRGFVLDNEELKWDLGAYRLSFRA